MQTNRVTFLASDAEKTDLFAKSRRLGISCSEVIRRALKRDDGGSEDEAEAAALVAEAKAAIPKMQASLERINARLENMNRKNEAFLADMGIIL